MAAAGAGDSCWCGRARLIPADGMVIEGASERRRIAADRRERVPVAKRAGDAVIGGSVNLDQPAA